MRDMKRKGRGAHPTGDRTGGRVSSKLDWARVEEIRTLYASGKFTCRTIGRMFCVSAATVSRIVNNNLWSIEPEVKEETP